MSTKTSTKASTVTGNDTAAGGNDRPAIIDGAHHALFLDVDGTLLDIEPHPDKVVAEPSLCRLLEELARQFGGAVALVSGRTVAALDRIFDPLRLPAAGAHGSEIRLPDREPRPLATPELPERARAALKAFTERHDGLLLEDKPGGASLHYRRAPELENECRQFVQDLMDDLRPDDLHSGFRIIDGKMVLEIAPTAASKGEAIRSLMHEAPFAGRRPVFVGDDVTDEDGFRVVNALGGLSIRVGSLTGSEARWSLADVRDVRDWLVALGNGADGDAELAQP